MKKQLLFKKKIYIYIKVMSVMCIFDLNLDLSDKINEEVIKLKKLKKIKEKQKQNKSYLLDHINMIGEILTIDDTNIINVFEDTELLDAEYCNEYILEDEYEFLQQQRYEDYCDLNIDS